MNIQERTVIANCLGREIHLAGLTVLGFAQMVKVPPPLVRKLLMGVVDIPSVHYMRVRDWVQKAAADRLLARIEARAAQRNRVAREPKWRKKHRSIEERARAMQT